MTANPARSSARNLTTLLSFSQCARRFCLTIAFLGKCVGVVFIQKPSYSNPHNPVLNLKLLRTSALEIRTLHHPLLQGHSLWLSLGGWPTWEIISHLLQPRWCYYKCRPLVRTQTESPAKWLKAVSQRRAKLTLVCQKGDNQSLTSSSATRDAQAVDSVDSRGNYCRCRSSKKKR